MCPKYFHHFDQLYNSQKVSFNFALNFTIKHFINVAIILSLNLSPNMNKNAPNKTNLWIDKTLSEQVMKDQQSLNSTI